MSKPTIVFKSIPFKNRFFLSVILSLISSVYIIDPFYRRIQFYHQSVMFKLFRDTNGYYSNRTILLIILISLIEYSSDDPNTDQYYFSSAISPEEPYLILLRIQLIIPDNSFCWSLYLSAVRIYNTGENPSSNQSLDFSKEPAKITNPLFQ